MLDVGPLGLAFVSEAVRDCLELGRRPRLGPAVGPTLVTGGCLRVEEGQPWLSAHQGEA